MRPPARVGGVRTKEGSAERDADTERAAAAKPTWRAKLRRVVCGLWSEGMRLISQSIIGGVCSAAAEGVAQAQRRTLLRRSSEQCYWTSVKGQTRSSGSADRRGGGAGGAQAFGYPAGGRDQEISGGGDAGGLLAGAARFRRKLRAGVRGKARGAERLPGCPLPSDWAPAIQ